MSDGTVVVAVRFPEMSLRGPRLLRRTARWLKAEIDAGCRLVVVVGTRSRREDRGLELAGAREIDRARAAAEDLAVASLALALSTLGVSARSLSARDIELEGEGGFGAGVVKHLDARYVTELLARDITPVLAGGHVLRADGETVMLEPGGADLTAVTLAGVLCAPCHVVVDHGARPGVRLRRIRPDALTRAEALGVPVVQRNLEPRPPLVLESATAAAEPIATPLGGLL
jgi:aspartate kinase